MKPAPCAQTTGKGTLPIGAPGFFSQISVQFLSLVLKTGLTQFIPLVSGRRGFYEFTLR